MKTKVVNILRVHLQEADLFMKDVRLTMTRLRLIHRKSRRIGVHCTLILKIVNSSLLVS